MPDNYYHPDDSTDKIPPRGQDPQGKLILGGPSSQPSHQPHQHQPKTPYQYQQADRQPYAPPPSQPYGQNPGPSPYGNAAAAPPSNYQPGQMGNRPPQRRRRKKRGCLIGCLSVLIVVVILSIAVFSIGQRVLAFGSAISTKAPLTTETGYMTTGNRTNLLIMGYGGVGHDGAYLTDSLVVISMIPSTQHTSLISVPRDLWVSDPDGSQSYTKINAIATVASNNGQNLTAGGDATASKISKITGLDVNHWMFIDFNGFKQFIDAIGGVDINVPDSFTANYPANDDPNVNASWITIHFSQGEQHMDGTRAIEYARAREVTDNQAEGTDFARSLRQQLIIKAALGKVQSVSTWPSFYKIMDSLQQAIHTNFSLADLGLFSKKMNLSDPKTPHIGLNQSNVMTTGFANDGESIVYPLNWDWSIIPPYIKSQLYN